MRPLMSSLRLLLIWFMLFAPAARAAEGAPLSAEALFEKQRFLEALPLFEEQAAGSKGDPHWKAIYRTVECEALAFQYENAADRLAKVFSQASSPPPSPWNLRLEVLQA